MGSANQTSFGLDGTDIYGGSFYNVSGNVNQVFNSQATRTGGVQGQATQSSLVNRTNTRSMQGVGWPYPPANSGQRHIRGRETDYDAWSQDPWSSLLAIPSTTNSSQHRIAGQETDDSATSRDPLPPEQAALSGGNLDNWHNLFLETSDPTQQPYSGDGATSRDPFPPEQVSLHGGAPVHDSFLEPPELRHLQHFGDAESAAGHIENNTYSVGGDLTQIRVISVGESGIDALYRHVVIEALHNSGERFPDPACHPGTRRKILQDLTLWSLDIGVEPMLWLHGSAGIGKSAIAQMFSGNCDNQGRLGASFFFKSGHPKRGTWDKLITTIAYQLAKAIPEFSLLLQQAIEDDKLVVGRSIAIQFDRLLVEPFRSLSDLPLKPIVILDGLDECADRNHQRKILQLFIRAVRACQLPIRLLVASRPEPHLREVLEGEATLKLCRPLVLAADPSAYDDVRIFLRDEFSRIRSKFTSRGVDLGDAWPPTDTVEHLVHKSSGIFIYATTAIRFIDDEYSHPADRLATVLSLDPSSTAPLDDLYTEILSRLSHEPEKLCILHAIVHPEGLEYTSPEDVDTILCLSSGRTRLMLRSLHSLFRVPPHQTPLVHNEPVENLHSTLVDYLCDPRRSGKWCIEIPELHRDMLKSVLRFLSNTDITGRSMLRRDMINKLPDLLRGVAPSPDLVDLLRHSDFQESVFLSYYTFEDYISTEHVWPKEDSSYPLDLIQLWKDHNWISRLVKHMLTRDSELKQITSPTCKFDEVYSTIFRQHPDVLLLVQTMMLCKHSHNIHSATTNCIIRDFSCILDLSFSTLKPFLVLRDHHSYPGVVDSYPEVVGNSVMEFLLDRQRAGSLYSHPQEILEHWMVLWARFAKQPIDSSDEMLESLSLGLKLIKYCNRNHTLLREVETLDLANLCRRANIDKGAHKDLHYYYFKPDYFCNVLYWLSKFLPPPAEAIASWERQLTVIKRCANTCKDATSMMDWRNQW